MSEFRESRRVNYSSDEVYCRYLGIELPLSLRSSTYTGRFGQEMKKIGMEKLPFGIRLSDLILCGALKPSLYVTLPRDHFDGWSNFPVFPRQSDSNDENLAGMYSCHLLPEMAKVPKDLLHPYDGELKETFRRQFQTEVPESFPECNHPNNGKYVSAEAYVPYWQIYALSGNFYVYRDAECLLSPRHGKRRCLDIIKPAAQLFIKKYEDVFDRVSWYKTLSAGASFSAVKFTSGQIIELAGEYSKITVDLLRQDLRRLLELDAGWCSIHGNRGYRVLENARIRLSKDIYLVYEQLLILGAPAASIFEEFSLDNPGDYVTPLHEVLQSEGYELKQSFVSLGQLYCGTIQAWNYNCTEQVFDVLTLIPGFDAWIRAFHDLHASINELNKPHVSFRQSRIVDALILISVRTEIVLREMFRDKLDSKSDETIVSFLDSVKSQIQNDAKKVLETSRNEIKSRTKLNERPDELFFKIDELKCSNWSKKDIFFLHALLKFVAARNYFAHHAYKDGELNTEVSTLSRQILESSLATLLFFQKHKIV